MNWNVGRPILIILLLLLDLLLINNIVQNEKQEVLGVKIKTEKTTKSPKPKISPPVLSFELANKKYPSLKPSAQPSPSLTPIPNPSSTPNPIPSETPKSSLSQSIGVSISSQASVQIKSSSNSLIDQINSFRSSKSMTPVSENTETCAFAKSRANEIVSNFNHDGFTGRVNSNSLPYPTYSSVAENIAMNSDANQVVPNWINSPGHAENLLKEVPFGCVRSNGNYFVFEAWKP